MKTKTMIDLKGIFKKDYIIGIDIGSSSVKIAQFTAKEGGALSLVKADLKEIKVPSDEAADERELISAIRHLTRGIDLKKSKVIASVNCPHTAIKKVLVPYMPRTEIREGIRMGAKNYFPFHIDNALLDFEILGDVVEKGVKKYEILVATSPRKTIDKYLSLLEKAGVRPSSFVPASYALQKIAQSAGYVGVEGTTCLIDIGSLHTELVIVKGKSLVFSRKIPIAGDDFTKAMTGSLVSDRGKTQLSLDEAEKIKREIGIPSETEPRIINDKISTTQILSMLRTPLDQLTSEIERSFDYYREESDGGKIDSVILFGSGASLAGLTKFLSEALGIEVRLGDSDKFSHRVGLAVGAALSGPKGINLLPLEIKEETKRLVRRGTIEAVVTAITLIAILTYIGMKIRLNNFQKRTAVANLELSSLQPQLKTAQEEALASSILAGEPHWEDAFKELSNLIPDTVHIENIKMENSVITIKGIVSAEAGEQVLAGFIRDLEKGLFNNVRLMRSETLREGKGLEFEVKCWVDL